MAIVNTYRFALALAIYLAAVWALGHTLGLVVGRWPYEVIVALTFAFLLAYGALAFLMLRGPTSLRLALVALLAPLSYVVQFVLFGAPLQIGLLAEEAVSLVVGAVLAALSQWFFQRHASEQRNEA
jgi:hypothetical protein